jgi:hypothetical protein
MSGTLKKKVRRLRDQKGVTLILVAGLTVMFVAFIALSVDIAHLYAVRNELQNAADAGALAGARRLLAPDGVTINTGANQFAYDAATDNRSERVAVNVDWMPGENNGSDVERGHWSFATHTFTPNDAGTQKANWWNIPTESLDIDTDFINAVRVKSRRESPQADSFFARILGYAGFNVATEAVGYIGFAGQANPGDVGGALLICKQALIGEEGNYTCTVGREINAGSTSNHNTGGWTNYTQAEACSNPSGSEMRTIFSTCLGNTDTITYGDPISSNGGQLSGPAFVPLRNCWLAASDTNGDGEPDIPWDISLIVIDCGDTSNVNGCLPTVGIVKVSILWITNIGNDPHYNEVPRHMSGWVPSSQCPDFSTDAHRLACWQDFAQNFQLKNVDNVDAPYEPFAIYYTPHCGSITPTGVTGGQNFGIQALIPVLVD